MPLTFNIGEGLRLSLDFVTQTQAILAKRGAGKSYLASVQAEEMLKANQQVVIVDPTGAMWGLKSSADGKHPGFTIVIFGGEHADVPLEENAGDIVASAIVENRFSAIIDLSLFRKGQMIRFMAPFLESLYRLNREPMHLIVDEADAVAPQRPFSEEARTLGAMEDVVRRGRKRGIGCTMISQRAAVLNKNVLTQAEILCALRLIHPKDIDAVHEWVNVHGDPDRAKQMISSLPSLPIGSAWFWAPGWGDIFTKVKIRKRETFDSSSTPVVGKEARKPTVMASVDIEKLGEKIKATVTKAKENDPKLLRQRILQLESELKRPQVIAVEDPVVQKLAGDLHRKMELAYRNEFEYYRKGLIQAREAFKRIGQLVQNFLEYKVSATGQPRGVRWTKEMIQDSLPQQERFISVKNPIVVRANPTPKDGRKKLRAGAERMLAALVQWQPNWLTEGQVRSHAGLRKSGTFSTYLSDLFGGGYIERQGDRLRTTGVGIAYFGGDLPQAPSTTEEVMSIWIPKLRYGAIRILKVLVALKGESISLEALAQEAELSKSGTFSTYLSDLRTAKLIETGNGQAWANTETLFL